MQYLNFGRKYEVAAVTGDISRLPGKNCLFRQAQMIGTRLFCEEEESISNSSHSEEESIEILKEKPLTLDEKLVKAIYSKTKVLYCSTKKSTSFNKIMKQEMQLFDSTESPSPNIIKLCDALKTIPPTSVEAKRAFSAAGLFVTKLKTRLRDKTSEEEAVRCALRILRMMLMVLLPLFGWGWREVFFSKEWNDRDIRVLQADYSSIGFDSVMLPNSFIIERSMAITLPANFTVFAFSGVVEDGCFRSLLCCFMSLIISCYIKVSHADFCFHFDNWVRLVGALKQASVRSHNTQEYESVHAIYR
ncbi:uncharacterized protein TNCV_3269951 [Trichonephila clavipes]|uniref:HAT C-terminal dimerisation domain-containing protein n=1 Tax=Trichonephila clavipes TaxID=2585209 RepID=A0A8X6VEN3_TRICX|nr:uncharacterized protein TNCV_3269951 [Trichonephila clavipes]